MKFSVLGALCCSLVFTRSFLRSGRGRGWSKTLNKSLRNIRHNLDVHCHWSFSHTCFFTASKYMPVRIDKCVQTRVTRTCATSQWQHDCIVCHVELCLFLVQCCLSNLKGTKVRPSVLHCPSLLALESQITHSNMSSLLLSECNVHALMNAV